MADFKGKDLYLFFGFSKCQGVCPINLGKFIELSDSLKNRPDESAFLFISIDPVRDRKENLKQFLGSIGTPKNFKGLLSGKDSTFLVARKFNASFEYDEKKAAKDNNYQIQHAGYIYYIDSQGMLKLVYPQKNPEVKLMLKDLEKIRKL